MQRVIREREVIVLNGVGVVVFGTYHKTSDQEQTSGRVGVVIVNSLSPSRAAAGDSAVYWADSFASVGYPVFRLDLPGFGDSEGDPAPDLLRVINTGGYAPITTTLITELKERFNLVGVVIMGLCAGAVTALYTASMSKESKGLILIDPYFHLPIKDDSWLWQKLTGRISRSAGGRLIEKAFGCLRDFRLKLRRNRLPQNANFSLLKCWRAVTSAGLPMLLFKAPSIRPRGEELDYLKYLLEQTEGKSHVELRVIKGAGHTFSNLVGRTAVQSDTKKWLQASFPIESLHAPQDSSLICEHAAYDRCHLNYSHR